MAYLTTPGSVAVFTSCVMELSERAASSRSGLQATAKPDQVRLVIVSGSTPELQVMDFQFFH